MILLDTENIIFWSNRKFSAPWYISIFLVKYFPFIFSISGSRIVIIVSFIFLQSRKGLSTVRSVRNFRFYLKPFSFRDVLFKYHRTVVPRSCKRSETLFKSLLFWLAVEVLTPCQKWKSRFLKQNFSPFATPWVF